MARYSEVRPAVKLSCVILTMGDRPEELRRAVEGVLHQQDAEVEVIVVGNGAALPELPGEVIALPLPENLGIPGGRNRGVEACSGDVILFLDDDGWYPSPRLAAHVSEAFATDPTLGVISFRIRDPEGGPGHRRHVPRLRAGDPARSSDVTTFLGGACAVRRQAYEVAGGLPDDFFYAHEETDLAWQVLDHGYRIRYDADAVMYHPAVKPTRHAGFFRMNARNRVWLARRNLPAPLIPVYLGVWVVLTVLRERRPGALKAWFGGFREGWKEPAGPRRPISWGTVWRMARTGRPPII
ncbi:MAG: glycosyltransferase [Streptosporangiales bacterium]|nr:glycosyltransferase [Streptosporangiales bacterium]